MKKVKIILIILITFLAFNYNVNAAGSATLNVSTSSVYVGDSFTASVTVYGAAWNIHVSASGPVTGCSINEGDATSDANDATKTFSTTCTTTGTGTVTLTLSGDVTSAADGNFVTASGSRSVNVVARPSQPVNPGGGGGGGYTPTPQPQQPQQQDNSNKSSNTNLKSLNVKGYTLKKETDGTYSLTVNKNTSSIIVEAVAEDSKTSITNNGENKLNIGKNTIEITLTAENGATKKYYIVVTRNDKDTITDLESLLKRDNKELTIDIKQGDILSSGNLNGLKKTNKNLVLQYLVDKQLIYGWTIKGNGLSNFNDFDTTVTINRNIPYYIDQITDNADGLYFKVSKSNNYANGLLLKLFVGDLYKDKTLLNVYLFDSNKLEFYATKVDVKDGYIEFPINKGVEFIVTDKTIDTSVVITGSNIGVQENDSFEVYYYVAIIVIIVLLSIVIAKIKGNLDKKKKQDMLDKTII